MALLQTSSLGSPPSRPLLPLVGSAPLGGSRGSGRVSCSHHSRKRSLAAPGGEGAPGASATSFAAERLRWPCSVAGLAEVAAGVAPSWPAGGGGASGAGGAMRRGAGSGTCPHDAVLSISSARYMAVRLSGCCERLCSSCSVSCRISASRTSSAGGGGGGGGGGGLAVGFGAEAEAAAAEGLAAAGLAGGLPPPVGDSRGDVVGDLSGGPWAGLPAEAASSCRDV